MLAASLLLAPAGAAAQTPDPFAVRVCSVFDTSNCYTAPQQYHFGSDLRVTIDSKSAEAYRAPAHDLDSIRDLFVALRACWRPPAIAVSRQGMQMSIRLSFKRNGELIAAPRVTFATPDASPETRQVYRDAIEAALARCAPLPLTSGFAGAIAGRPIAVRYRDNRDVEFIQAKSERP